ncbi:unnamed protein product [Triticum turgidum subsp. durum]|uniref:EIF3m n=1 Tax=Triticum turgidum subsp. durum TaxID=4567 RepID=A0A9R1QXP0_TRITD|nr:unnamed protein product [Triticum turgidum subsp. durum]
MATIVNTTEEEPMLAVVRSTAQLAWADAGQEVADPEVARLCAEAQQHLLAARWLDMATLILASADLLLLSPSAPDKAADLECSLTVVCNLVTKAGSEDEALEIAKLICAKLTHQPANKPTLRIKVLFSLYNLLPSLSGKAMVYRKALELAAAAGKAAADCVVPTFKNIDAFVAYWGIGKPEQRELFLAVTRILKDHKGMTKDYFKFLNKYLATFDGSADDAGAIGAAKEEAAAAIVEFLKSSDLYQCDLLDMPAVAQLEKDEKYQPVYELLKIFLTQRLESYLAFQTANSTLLQGYDWFMRSA